MDRSTLLGFIGGMIVALLVVLIVILLNDGGADEGVAGSGSTSSTAAATTSSPTTTAPAATTSTTAAATTTTAPAGACAAIPGAIIPGPEPGVTFAGGDFDGDGSDDRLIGYEDAGGTWWVQIALDYGYATQTAVPGPVTALGSVYFGGDQAVGYAYVDAGASTSLVGFFFLPGCDVFEVTVDTGPVARFPVGGGVQHLDGVTCVDEGIITKSAATSNGTTWEYSTTRWAWVPGLLELQPVTSSIALLSSPADDAVIFGAGSFDCPVALQP